MKKWSIAGAALCLALTVGCKGKDADDKGAKEGAKPTAEKTADKAGEEPAGEEPAGEGPAGEEPAGEQAAEAAPAETVKTTPQALYEEWQKDEEATKAKYKGKTLEVEGTVTVMGQDFGGNTFVTLATVEDDIMGMKNALAKDAGHPWAKIAPGDKVKVVGTWPEFSMGPALMDAKVEAVGETTAAESDAAALVKEFSADSEAAEKKFEEKSVRVTGTVKEKKDDGGAVTAVLDGGEGTVLVGIGSMDKWAHAMVEQGKPLTALCKFSSYDSDSKEIQLYMCLPVKG